MTPIDDYLKELTREDVYADLLEIAAKLGLTTTAWQPGEPPRGLLGIAAEWIAKTWNAVVLPVLKAFFLDHASGPLLAIVALALWGVVKKGATFAGGSFEVENRSLLPHTFAPGDLVAKNGSDKLFRNVTGGFLAAWTGSGDYPTLPLDWEAIELGAASTTPAGGIVVEPVAAPAGVFFVTNETPLLGQDEEADPQLRNRCRKATGPLSPGGAAAAHEYVALSTRVPDGTEEGRTLLERLLVSRETDVAVNVNRVRVLSSPSGVRVRLASPAGGSAGDVGTEGSDVYLVNQAVQILVVPTGIPTTVEAAAEVTVTRSLQVLVLRDANVTIGEAATAVEAAVLGWFQTHPIGGRKLTPGGQGYVLMKELEGVAKASKAGIYQVTASGDNEPLEDDEVALPAITIAVTLVSQ
ncbi:MAG: hypothetical protein IT372_42625 [Polyangiaceae bacterium]|nr:hypothetical protein [Polyangiaceae bacterium]